MTSDEEIDALGNGVAERYGEIPLLLIDDVDGFGD